IQAAAETNLAASGGSATGGGTVWARNGQLVTNVVLARADAYALNSSLTSTTGDITVDARSGALIDATLHSSVGSGDEAISFAIAFNTIGWQAQNVFFNAIDALLGDPVLAD